MKVKLDAIIKRIDSMQNDINALKILGNSSMVPDPITTAQLTNLENNRQS